MSNLRKLAALCADIAGQENWRLQLTYTDPSVGHVSFGTGGSPYAALSEAGNALRDAADEIERLEKIIEAASRSAPRGRATHHVPFLRKCNCWKPG